MDEHAGGLPGEGPLQAESEIEERHPRLL